MIALRQPAVLLDDPMPVRVASVSEAALFRGYSRPSLVGAVRTEACACGTAIELWTGQDIPDVVAAHNRTEAHDAWSAQTRLL